MTTDQRNRYVFLPRLRCPVCRSADVRAYRTMPQEPDGSQSRYTACRGCGWKFITVIEDEFHDVE